VGAEPEQLERDIAKTRERLGQNVDLLAEKVSPAAAAKRGIGRIRDAATSVRENVMGTVTDKAGSAGDTLGSGASEAKDTVAHAKDSVADAASQAKDTVAEAAQSAKITVRRQTQGNPLAAGVIAFGVGWLVSSLIPATKAEEQLGEQLKGQAGTIKDTLSSAASEVVDDLREPAKQAVEQVKETAADSASTVKDEASGQASDLTGEAKDRSQNVAETAQSGGQY
jgi:gas vesicle protein